LLWKWSSTANSRSDLISYRGHRDFISALCTQLLHSNNKTEEEEESHIPPIIVPQRHYKHVHEKSHDRYEWEKLHPLGCPRKKAPKRKFGTNITKLIKNGASETILGGFRTYYKCSKC
jgi:hypothetical protein